jgi:hypothetical protein
MFAFSFKPTLVVKHPKDLEFSTESDFLMAREQSDCSQYLETSKC